jgi:hypothetical protein
MLLGDRFPIINDVLTHLTGQKFSNHVNIPKIVVPDFISKEEMKPPHFPNWNTDEEMGNFRD